MKKFLLLTILVFVFSLFIPNSYSLTEDSQKILNNYHNYEQSGSPPATSQPYSPNNPPPTVNAVPAPKTNVVPPTQNSYSPFQSSPSSSNSQNNPTSSTPPNSPFIWVGIIIMIIVVIFAKAVRKGKSTSQGGYVQTSGPLPRRSFSKDVQHQTLMRQGGKCAMCGEFSKTWDADHKNGDRSDDSPYNCQMLCPNCHTYKSRRSQMGLD